MIYLLHGENSYKRDTELARLVGGSEVERYAGDEIDEPQLVDILAGATLFSAERTVVIGELSTNKPVWSALPEWLERLDTTTTLVLCELHLDKRTKTYKYLQTHASVIPCDFLRSPAGNRDMSKWLSAYAREQGVAIPETLVDDMIERATRPGDYDDKPIIDQQLLASTVQQLRSAGEVTKDLLDTVLTPSSYENVFGLLGAALDGKMQVVDEMIERLRVQEDGHKVFGLLASQVVNLASLQLAGRDRSVEQVAVDVGLHPFALRQMSRYRDRFSRRELRQIVGIIADGDLRLKRSQAEPWVLLRHILSQIVRLTKLPG